MMKDRIYVDTSVVGGYFDKVFEEDTRIFFQRLERREVIFVISDLLELELLESPSNVRELLLKYPYDCFERVTLTKEAMELADLYIDANVVGKSSIEDCRHIGNCYN